MIDQRLWNPSGRRSRIRRITLILAGAKTVIADGLCWRLITASFDSILLKSIAKGSCVESQKPCGLFLDPHGPFEGFQEQVFFYAIDKSLQVQSVFRQIGRHSLLLWSHSTVEPATDVLI